MFPKLLHLAALGVLTMVGCGDSSSPTGPDDTAELPLEFRVHATAFEEFPDGWAVECLIDVIVSLEPARSPAPGRREYHGSMGGEASRAILDQQGAGVAFWADAYWPDGVARVIGPDSVEFSLGPKTGESRFWDAFNLIAGSKDADGRWSGAWTCYPLDIDGSHGGYADTERIAEGSWELLPRTSLNRR